ncbi:MAG: hypothetical protein RR314_07065 [Oscillospiraceae bacterium]
MRAKLAKFMAGRNGGDSLTRFISITLCVLLVIAMIIGGELYRAVSVIVIAGLFYCYFRMMSKNVTKRRAENAKYLRKKNDFFAYFSGAKDRQSQSKEYKFFRCPSCHTMLRVPRDKGKVKVVCRKCGTSFIKKT